MPDKFIVVGWPDIQVLMSLPEFEQNSYLVCDDKGMEDFGSSAYFVNEHWFNLVTKQIVS